MPWVTLTTPYTRRLKCTKYEQKQVALTNYIIYHCSKLNISFQTYLAFEYVIRALKQRIVFLFWIKKNVNFQSFYNLDFDPKWKKQLWILSKKYPHCFLHNNWRYLQYRRTYRPTWFSSSCEMEDIYIYIYIYI